MPLSPKGIPYIPDGYGPASQPPKPRSLVAQAVLFVLVFVVLQAGYSAVRETWVERLLIDTLTVKTAAAVINTITPDVSVVASGTRLKASGGGINILNGCEGTEVLFLLVAAFVAFPLHWRIKLLGLLSGVGFVFVLNELRILALFYAFRRDPSLFDLLHTIVAPVILIALTTLFFYAFLHTQQTTHRCP